MASTLPPCCASEGRGPHEITEEFYKIRAGKPQANIASGIEPLIPGRSSNQGRTEPQDVGQPCRPAGTRRGKIVRSFRATRE